MRFCHDGTAFAAPPVHLVDCSQAARRANAGVMSGLRLTSAASALRQDRATYSIFIPVRATTFFESL